MLYNILKNVHNWIGYIVLIILLIATINAIMGWLYKKNFSSKDLRLSLFALIFCHIQMLLGLTLYFISPKGLSAFGEMKNSELRLTWLEHPLVNIIAIALITIGWSKHKKITDDHNKFKKIAIYYGIAFLLILSRFPLSS